jgi:hypothetical protein
METFCKGIKVKFIKAATSLMFLKITFALSFLDREELRLSIKTFSFVWQTSRRLFYFHGVTLHIRRRA